MNRFAELAYWQFLWAHRDRLRRCAVLLVGAEWADRLTDVVTARLYEAWPRSGDPAVAAYRLVLILGPDASVPWRRDKRVQLIDAPAGSGPVPLVRDVAALPLPSRRAFVLHAAGLDDSLIAAITGASPAEVGRQLAGATTTLVALDPRRADPAVLRGELAEVTGAPPPASLGAAAATGAEHGRTLVRRRRIGRALVAAGVFVVVVAGAAALRPAPPSGSSVSPASSPTASRSVGCDPNKVSCQQAVLRNWRAEMTRVVRIHLDPKGDYFTDYRFSSDPTYETPGFWTGDGGALGLTVGAVNGGTDVHLQIATGREYAVPCGRTTAQDCAFLELTDGNAYRVTETTEASQGLEVQYSPVPHQVITLVAENDESGPTLQIFRGDLINLAKDPRLRLPQL